MTNTREHYIIVRALDGRRRYWVFAPEGSVVEGGWVDYPHQASRMEVADATRWVRRVGGEVVDATTEERERREACGMDMDTYDAVGPDPEPESD